MIRTKLAAAVLTTLAAAAPAGAQVSADAPNVFLDCRANNCDMSHIRNEIRFVNWMRDRQDADVYMIATSQSTGGGGVSFEVTARGSRRFAGDSVDITFTAPQSATSSERRDALTNRIATVLVRYAALTNAAGAISIGTRAVVRDDDPTPVDDPWNRWVFSTSVSAELSGESREREQEIRGSLGADRVTEALKFQFNANGEYYWEELELSDNRIVTNERRDIEANVLLAHAVAPRWSAGVRLDAGTSTFANQDFFARTAALLEYSFLPYSEFSRRQIMLQYTLGARYFDYEEETIYDRLSEQRADHQLALNLNFRQPWGSARLELSGAHYLHDVGRYNLSSFGNLNVRLLRGFSIDLNARYARVRDQLYIPKGDATDEEVLLRRRALETGYRYSTSVGLRYTFGSIYNAAVNPRLSRDGGRFR